MILPSRKGEDKAPGTWRPRQQFLRYQLLVLGVESAMLALLYFSIALFSFDSALEQAFQGQLPPPLFFWLLSALLFCVMAAFIYGGAYHIRQLCRPVRLGKHLCVLVVCAFLLLLSAFLFSGLQIRPGPVLVFTAFAGFGLLSFCFRLLLAKRLEVLGHRGRLVRRVGMLNLRSGTRYRGRLDRLLEGLNKLLMLDDELVAHIVELPPVLLKKGVQHGELLSELSALRCDELVITGKRAEMKSLQEDPWFEAFPVRIRFWDGQRLEEICPAPMGNAGSIVKRFVDILGALFILVVMAPLMALVALAIKIESPGPIIFEQVRYGYLNRTFKLWKFRSMYHHKADKSAEKLTLRKDPRVTRVGAFIRRTSIDELPQLFNVLLGDMSLVGPRPHPLKAKAGDRFYEDVVVRFERRYRVKPGLTGLAQVSGLRGNTDTEDKLILRFEKDMIYARKWNLWRDLFILMKTPLASVIGENAY